MNRLLLPTIAILFGAPFAVHATVVINEVAWMGSVSSPNDEWIELYNNGSTSVSMKDWSLSDGASLTISLTGSISAGKYVVLERTDDTTIPGVHALLTYTGALSNTGRTLVLRRADGSIENEVIGGNEWKNIGGDNATKYTAQRTSGGWTTASPTPGGQNALPKIVTQPPVPVPVTLAQKPSTDSKVVHHASIGATTVTPNKPEPAASSSVGPEQTVSNTEESKSIPIGNPRTDSGKGTTNSRLPYLGLVVVICIASAFLFLQGPKKDIANEL